MIHPSQTWTLVPLAASTVTDRQTSTIVPGVDWAIDLVTGDLIFPLRYTTGLEAVAQGVRIRLLNFRGEWMLNLDDGVPYMVRDGVTADQAILGQKFDTLKAEAAFREAIAAAPGVTEISELSVSFEPVTRTLSVSFEVRSTFGTITVDELEL